MRVVGEAFMDSSSYLAEAEKLLDRGFLLCNVGDIRSLNELLVAYKGEEAEDIVLFLACVKNWVYYQFFLRRDIISRIVKIPRGTRIIMLGNSIKCIKDSKENVMRSLEESVVMFKTIYEPDDRVYYNNMLLDISKGMQYYIFRGSDSVKVFAWILGLLDKELVVESIDNSYTVHFVR